MRSLIITTSIGSVFVLCACQSVAQETRFPAPSSRIWTDVTGKFSIDAKLVEVKDGKAWLLKSNGKTISVPLEKLSDGDRAYIAEAEQPSIPFIRSPRSHESLSNRNEFENGLNSVDIEVAKRLEGTWNLIEVQTGNNISISLDSPKPPSVSFSFAKNGRRGNCSVMGISDSPGGNAYLGMSGLYRSSQFVIGAVDDLKTIDFTDSEGQSKKGIFEFDARQRLRICLSSTKHPKEFVTEKAMLGEFRVLLLLERNSTGELPKKKAAGSDSARKLPSNWPAISGRLVGQMEVRVTNPNTFKVRVGLRSSGRGKDFTVNPGGTESVYVPNGSYDIYFEYSDDPESLYQGDSFTLADNGVEIQIVQVVNGNYGIRKVR